MRARTTKSRAMARMLREAERECLCVCDRERKGESEADRSFDIRTGIRESHCADEAGALSWGRLKPCMR